MEKIYTATKATFTTESGKTISYQEIFDSVRTNVEVYGKTGGRELSAEELEDLCQDSILRTLKYRGSFDPAKSSAKTWASRIAGNARKDAYKEHQKQLVTYVHPRTYLDKDDASRSFFDTVEGGREASFDIESKEAVGAIYSAIDSLNEKYRLVIYLHLEGLTAKQMANKIGCPVRDVHTLLCRARKALRKTLDNGLLAA